MMHRADFVRIAAVLRTVLHNAAAGAEEAGVRNVVAYLAELFETNYAHFNKAKFLEAVYGKEAHNG